MKMPKLFVAAGLMVAALGVSTSANAQRYDNSRHYDQRYDNHRRYDNDRRHYSDRRYYGRDRGRYGWNDHRRCWSEWRHHHNVRVCR